MDERCVVLIGPVCVGKSTVLPLLAERLGRPAVDLDDVAEAYYAEVGRSRDEMNAIGPTLGDLGTYRWFQEAHPHAVRRVLEDNPGAVIALGAGHTVFVEPRLRSEVRAVLDEHHSILLRAEDDETAAIQLLRARSVAERDHDWIMDGHDLLAEWVERIDNVRLASEIVVTAGLTVDEVVESLVAAVGDIEAYDEVADLVTGLLEVEPLHYSDLGVAVEKALGVHALTLLGDLIAHDGSFHERDGVVCLTSSIVDGMTFTHRVTVSEVVAGALTVQPDLGLLLWDTTFLTTEDGAPLTITGDPEADLDRIGGPDGWLPPMAPDLLVAVTRTADAVTVRAVDVLGDGSAEIAALRGQADELVYGAEAEELLWDAMVEDRTLFRAPVPPVSELLVAAGLERRHHQWGPTDGSWLSGPERIEAERARLYATRSFEPCCVAAYEQVVAGWGASLSGDPFDADAVAEALAHRDVAAAFGAEHPQATELVVRFARRAGRRVEGRARSGPLALEAVARLASGAAEDAQQRLEEAVGLDPAFAAAASALAEILADRGDIDGALRVAENGSAAIASWLRNERTTRDSARPKVGRNDPCPCGSGRKSKHCHDGATPLDLRARAGFLLRRIARFALVDAENRAVIAELATTAAAFDPRLLADLLEDPFLIDLAIHEGGVGESYLDERGPLLPDDERDLLELTLDTERDLWEVVDVRPGRSTTLLSTTLAERIEVGDLTATVGGLLLGRFVDAGGWTTQFGTLVAVPPALVDAVVDILEETPDDADALAEWYGDLKRHRHA